MKRREWIEITVEKDVSRKVWSKKERVEKKENVKNYKSQELAAILTPTFASQELDMRRGKM